VIFRGVRILVCVHAARDEEYGSSASWSRQPHKFALTTAHVPG